MGFAPSACVRRELEDGEAAAGHAGPHPATLGPGELTLQILLAFQQERQKAWLCFWKGMKMKMKTGGHISCTQCYIWDAAACPAHSSLDHSCCPHRPLPVSHPPAKSPAEGVPGSYLFAEDLLALGIVDPRCPAPVSKALPVAIV